VLHTKYESYKGDKRIAVVSVFIKIIKEIVCKKYTERIVNQTYPNYFVGNQENYYAAGKLRAFSSPGTYHPC
jgi:hypothetical protein